MFCESCVYEIKKLLKRGDFDGVMRLLRCEGERRHSSQCIYQGVTDPAPKMSPVGMAVSAGNMEVVRALISSGFDPNECCSVDNFLKRPVHVAICAERVDIVKSLVHDYGVKLNDEGEGSALFWAIVSGSLELVAYLYDRTDDPSLEQAIFTAVEFNKPSICSYILSRGVDLELRCPKDLTPLAYAISLGNTDIVKILINAGSEVEGVFPRGNSMIHLGVMSGQLDIVKYLCRMGVDVNKQNKYSNTPLHLAALCGLYDIAYYLVVDMNACLTKVEVDRKTPFATSLSLRHTDIAHLILAAGYFPTQEEFSSVLDDKDLSKSLKVVVTNPRSLKECAVFAVKRHFGRDLFDKWDQLTLPRPVKAFFKLSHISQPRDVH
ncbi:serine/threonine-protein phosphatase 6 regulatory ankyrin repeat subunit A-like [Haliotis rubra]|uniref:serine/threonine-protein phosphatase 6 regulatory ankyrin repeat subunit A-like n=1 Tax=Haliotis rubra TaxID=36100 RepID=UPI001EE5001B|nr:serine/threonine-protein phosphatase 6 regulatory ankyrin repeat subunit A-like [Haliotis rubra]